jgi:hypothetical protein
MAPSRRTPFALLALAAAALLSSWSPASATLGLAVGLMAAGLCLEARRQTGTLGLPMRVALGLAVVAVLVSAVVLARTAGAGRAFGGSPVVEGVPSAERREALDSAAETTRAGRDAARKELDALEPRR